MMDDRKTRDEPLWTIEEAALYLNLTPQTVRAYVREKALPAAKFGRYWRIRGEDVRAFGKEGNQ